MLASGRWVARAPAGHHSGGKLRIPSARLPPAGTAASLAAPLPAASPSGADPACGPQAQRRLQTAGTCPQAHHDLLPVRFWARQPPAAGAGAPGTARGNRERRRDDDEPSIPLLRCYTPAYRQSSRVAEYTLNLPISCPNNRHHLSCQVLLLAVVHSSFSRWSTAGIPQVEFRV